MRIHRHGVGTPGAKARGLRPAADDATTLRVLTLDIALLVVSCCSVRRVLVPCLIVFES